MKIIKVSELEQNPSLYAEIAEVIASQGLVIIPGLTTYRMAVDVLSAQAVSKLQQGKRQVQNKPALVFVSHKKRLDGLVADVPDVARQLIANFWPGHLTIRFDPGDRLPAKVRKSLTKATGKIGVRVPSADVCAATVAAFDGPILVSSANRSKKGGAQSLAQVRKNFGNVADVIIDAGDLPAGSPSTIVDVSDKGWTMVREGSITAATIAEKIGAEPL
ncbi:MAG: L-threonylcarbamoyladenylate synthase [bacterium]